MVQSVLSSLTLGYRPLWNQARRLAGIQLYLHEEPGARADVAHLLRILRETWGTQSPPVLLSPQSRQVLCDLLENASKGSPWIEVRGDWLQDSAIYDLVRQAHARGLMLVWRGPLSDVPDAESAHWFASSLLYLPPEGASGLSNQTALSLQQAAQAAEAPGKLQALKQAARPTPPAPLLQLLGGQMYEGLESLALADLCLDRFHAGAIAGWPVTDTLYAQRHQPALPGRDTVMALMRAVDAEHSLDAFEQILGRIPSWPTASCSTPTPRPWDCAAMWTRCVAAWSCWAMARCSAGFPTSCPPPAPSPAWCRCARPCGCAQA